MSQQKKQRKADKIAVKTLFDETNYKMYLEMLKVSKMPYVITRTNYTLRIESEFVNAYFMQNVMSNKAFVCGNMIRRDILKSGVVMPEIDRDELQYFRFNHKEILKSCKEPIYNIDIKSAYAYVLNSHGLILKETFGYLSSLSKKDRLAAVGILAARKDVFSYDGEGDCVAHEKIVKDTANWFFFCVLEIQNIMLAIREMIGNDFLFFWVDGIFFKNAQNRDKIENFLREKGYKNSFDECTDFRYISDNLSEYVTYHKVGDIKPKILNMPKVNSHVDRYLLKLLGITNKI